MEHIPPADDTITDPVTPPGPDGQPAPHPDQMLPSNPVLQFWYDPANANLIALMGWSCILVGAYVYFFGKPKFLERRSDYSDNYYQQETEQNKNSREEYIKQLMEKNNEGAAERKAAALAKHEEERRRKLEIAEGKMKAREMGQHFSGESNSLGEDDTAAKIAELKAMKKNKSASKSTKSLRDDDFNPLSGSSSSGARYRNTRPDCGPRGG